MSDTPDETTAPEGTDADEQATEQPAEEVVQPRRGRGHLEIDVKAITDRYVTGEFKTENDEPLTPHRIAKAIPTVLGTGNKPPSTGAVAEVLKRWKEIGFAELSEGPTAFSDYTDAAREFGLSKLREDHKARKAEERAAARAAEKAAAADNGDA